MTAGQATLEGLLIDLDRSTEVVARAREQADGLAVLLLAVTGVGVPQQVIALGDELQQAATAFSGAEKALGEAAQKAREAEQAEKDGPNVEMCRTLIGEHQRLADLKEQVTRLDDECKSADEQHRTAAEKASKIRDRLELLNAAVERGEHGRGSRTTSTGRWSRLGAVEPLARPTRGVGPSDRPTQSGKRSAGS